MPDDLVLRVRQITQYPLKAQADPTDAILVQNNGLGGPYQTVSAYGLIVGALDTPNAALNVGIPMPFDAGMAGVLASNLVTGLGCRQGFNWYDNSVGGVSLLRSGAAGRWCFDGNRLSWNVSNAGTMGQQITTWACAFAVDASGNLTAPGQGQFGCLDVLGDAAIGGNLAVEGDENLAGCLFVTGNINGSSNLSIAGTGNFGGALNVNGQGQFGSLLVNGVSTFRNTINAQTINAVTGNFSGSVAIGGNLSLAGSVGNLKVNGWETIASSLEVADIAAFSNGILVAGNGEVCGCFAVGGDLQLHGNSCTDGYAGFAADAGVVGLLDVFGDVDVTGNIAANGNITAGGSAVVTVATLNSDLMSNAWLLATFAPIASPAFTGIPTAVTAPVGSSTSQLATTAFVANTFAGYAPLASPDFTGVPTAPTANPGTNSSQLATTAFVDAAVAASTTGVVSFNTRTGSVTLQWNDLSALGAAPLLSPGFSGTPTVPTAPISATGTQIANCMWVLNKITAISAGVLTFNNRSGDVLLTAADVTDVGGALLASPAFTGTPTAPTQTAGDNSTNLATTAFVGAAIAAMPAGVASFNSRTGAVTLGINDITAVGALANPSVALTGTPTAPTAAPGTSTTQLATTAFVEAAVTGISFPEAPTDGATYGRSNSSWVSVTAQLANYLKLAGGTLTGALVLSGNATANLNPVTLQQMTAAIGTPVTSFNSRTGAVTLTSTDIQNAGGAFAASPNFTGNVLFPNWSFPSTGFASINNRLANTSLFTVAASGATQTLSFVNSSGTATGSILQVEDVTGGQYSGGSPGGWLIVKNATPGNPATIMTGGGDTNRSIAINPAGTGVVSTTGNLTVNGGLLTINGNNGLYLNKSASGQSNVISGYTNNSIRWQIVPGNNTAESGSNAGSDLVIYCYSDSGNWLATPLSIARSNGLVTIYDQLNVAGTGIYCNAGIMAYGGQATNSPWASSVLYAYATAASQQALLAYNSSGSGNAILARIDGTGTKFCSWYYGGSAIGSIGTGDGSNVGYYTSSDARLKDNITGIPEGDCARLFDRLRPVRFKWKALRDATPDYGFLAQEVSEIYPQAVTPPRKGANDDEMPWMMDHSKLVPMLVAEVQYLRRRLKKLEES